MKKSTSKKSNKRSRDPLAGNLSKMIERSELVPASQLFEFLPKNATIALRLPEELLKALKQRAKDEHKDTQKLIREALIHLVNDKAS